MSIAAIRDESNKVIQKVSVELEEKKSQAQNKRSRIDSLERDIKAEQSRISTQKDKIAEEEKSLKDLEKTLKEKQKELSSLEKQITTDEKQYLKILTAPVDPKVDVVTANRTSLCFATKLKNEAEVDAYVEALKDKLMVCWTDTMFCISFKGWFNGN